MKPNIPKRSLLSMQVCVPSDWTDAQVLEFAETENPCGTTNGWSIRKEGHELLCGSPERVACEGGYTGHVHIMLDA